MVGWSVVGGLVVGGFNKTHNTEDWKSNLCDYNNAYILVRGDITVTAAPATQISFEKCAPFTKCIIKTDATIIDYHNLVKYCSNCSETTGGLWFYSKDEPTNINANIANDIDFESFMYKKDS